MQTQPSSLSQEFLGAAETLIFGDGAGPGLLMMRRSLLQRICAQIDSIKPQENAYVGLLDVSVVTLLLLSLAANIFTIRFVRRLQQEKVNSVPVLGPNRESLAAEIAPTTNADRLRQMPKSTDLPREIPGVARLDSQSTPDVPPLPIPSPPSARTLLIAKKPAIIKPTEAFQFTVKGDPAPEVVWSSEGPGSIDPVYGLYRAPNKFAGETKVKIIARSWMGSQAVTFTLKGESLR